MDTANNNINAADNSPIFSKNIETNYIDKEKLLGLLEYNNMIVIFQEGATAINFIQLLNGGCDYLIEDCTAIHPGNIISNLAKQIARYHANESLEIRSIADEIRRQNWERTDNDENMRDVFIRLCLEMNRLHKYLIISNESFIKNLSREDVLILTELKNHCNCKILIVVSSKDYFSISQRRNFLFDYYNMKDKTKPLAYLSHHWGNISDACTKWICSELTKSRIPFAIDWKDAKICMKLIDMEETIADGLVVVAIIDEKYMESIDCMYELAKTRANGHIEKRLYPVILYNIDRKNEYGELDKHIAYWNSKIEELIKKAKDIGPGKGQLYYDNISKINVIQEQLPGLWTYFCEYRSYTLDDILEKGYEEIIDGIKEKIQALDVFNTSNINNGISSNTSVINNQFGSDSTIFNNPTGPITINN